MALIMSCVPFLFIIPGGICILLTNITKNEDLENKLTFIGVIFMLIALILAFVALVVLLISLILS